MNETTRKSLEQVVEEHGRYPIEAFEFVRQGLNHAVERIHGRLAAESQPDHPNHHVTGQQLSSGLRDYAIIRYGCMARAVLAHWNIHRTNDFGNIVFAMIKSSFMQKTETDDIHDFDNVFDFEAAFTPPPRPHTPTPTPVFRL